MAALDARKLPPRLAPAGRIPGHARTGCHLDSAAELASDAAGENRWNEPGCGTSRSKKNHFSQEIAHMLRTRSLPAIAWAVLVLPSFAWAQTKLELKIPDGEKTTSTVKVSSKQTLTLAGMNIDTSSEQEMVISTVNGKREADGTLRQQQKIDALKAKLSLPGGVELEFDSSKPDAAPAGTAFDVILDLIKVNAKASWTVVRGRDNRVTAIEGRDKILEGLDEAKRAMLQKQLDPAYLRDVANKELDKLPSRPVNKGDSWEVTETLRLEQGQNMTFKTKYTYEGLADHNGRQLDKINAETLEVSYGIDADAALPLKVSSAELKPKSLEGVILFDREKGNVAESRSSVQIQGTINFDINGQAVPANLDLTISNSSVTK
jgi:hypothetical protein